LVSQSSLPNYYAREGLKEHDCNMTKASINGDECEQQHDKESRVLCAEEKQKHFSESVPDDEVSRIEIIREGEYVENEFTANYSVSEGTYLSRRFSEFLIREISFQTSNDPEPSHSTSVLHCYHPSQWSTWQLSFVGIIVVLVVNISIFRTHPIKRQSLPSSSRATSNATTNITPKDAMLLHDSVTAPANLLVSKEGHSEMVFSVAYSPDGKHIASGSGDLTIKIWNADNGNSAVRTLKNHIKEVQSVAYSPDGNSIASGSRDGTIQIQDITHKLTMSIQTLISSTDDVVLSVAFSPDGRYIAGGYEDYTIKLWDIKEEVVVSTLRGHNYGVLSVSFSPDGNTIASGSYDKSVKIWEARNLSIIPLRSLNGHEAAVFSVAYSPDGQYIASGSGDNTVKIWNAKYEEAAIRTLTGHEHVVLSVAYSPDGQYIASGSYDGTVRIWNADPGHDDESPVRTLRGHTSWVLSVAFSPDGKYLASGSHDNSVKLWELL